MIQKLVKMTIWNITRIGNQHKTQKNIEKFIKQTLSFRHSSNEYFQKEYESIEHSLFFRSWKETVWGIIEKDIKKKAKSNQKTHQMFGCRETAGKKISKPIFTFFLCFDSQKEKSKIIKSIGTCKLIWET